MENVWIFFYGTFMSDVILREYGIECERTTPARLNGYELSIRPRVNLMKNADSIVYGGLAHISHKDICSLYGDLKDKFAIIYNPYPVITKFPDGSFMPALCYLSPEIQDAPAVPDYVEELAQCAIELEAPEIYVRHIKSFIRLGERKPQQKNK